MDIYRAAMDAYWKEIEQTNEAHRQRKEYQNEMLMELIKNNLGFDVQTENNRYNVGPLTLCAESYTDKDGLEQYRLLAFLQGCMWDGPVWTIKNLATLGRAIDEANTEYTVG